MTRTRTWIIVGASSGIGRSLAEELAKRGGSLVLVSSDGRDLDALAHDLTIRHGVSVSWTTDHPACPDDIDGLFFPIGAIDEGDDCLLPPARADALINTNFRSVVAVIDQFLPRMLEQRRGVIVGFGSIAAARGRTRNAIYAASKRALESYFESLRHRCEASGVAVQFYILGYVDTQLSFGKKLMLPKASPESVARAVVDGLQKGSGVRYLPKFWRLVTAVVRVTPWAIYKRLQF
jgi:short-subunit dehydrogenase